MSRDLPWNHIEKFVQELAWRDYWQQVWIAKGNELFSDLKNKQTPVSNHEIPSAVVQATTAIKVVDSAITNLYTSGYMHNHMRMYIAAICCNIAQSHWFLPSKWMYYHLLDGDIASNMLSWQWVAGSFSSKKYVANQDNINRYFNSTQKNTFLDVEYHEFESLEIPSILKNTEVFKERTVLPSMEKPRLIASKKTLIYNYYNLDPFWKKEEDVQRVLLIEPSIFERHPVSEKNIEFCLELANTIKNMKVFIGEFHELNALINEQYLVYKEHPLNTHYKGTEEPRDWMCNVSGYFPSFFSFWKKCVKEIKPS